MKLLITEFIVGGGLLNHPLPAGLKQEGLMMLEALIADCMKLAEVDILTTLDMRTTLGITGVHSVKINDSSSYISQIQGIAKNADLVWVIAPESEGVLATIISTLSHDGVCTIGSDVESIRIAGDKLRCAQVLQAAGVPVIPVLSEKELKCFDGEVVIKPRCGVGCDGVQVISNGRKALAAIPELDRWIAQQYMQGSHQSMSLLCCQGDARILSCNVQELSGFPNPRLKKCIVNAMPADAELRELAANIATALPGLNGYVGVDFIDTGEEKLIVEINPRLTTSYIGLADSLQQNPAKLCADVTLKKTLPDEIKTNNVAIEVNLV